MSTPDPGSEQDQANRDQAVQLMTQILTGSGMPADLADGAAADLVDMAIKQRASGGPD